MERELWRRMARGLRRLSPTRPRNAVYTDPQVLAVLLWAALNDRPISWACKRANWPMQAWRRSLPDQSTMSRRLRHPALAAALNSLAAILQQDLALGVVLVVDGKAMVLSENSRDPDARNGRAVSGYGKGYKIHIIIDPSSGAVAGWRIYPLNVAEPTTAAEILSDPDVHVPAGARLLGDAIYDSNPLHGSAASRGLQLIAPRKNPGTVIRRRNGARANHPNRLESVRLTEGDQRLEWDRHLSICRAGIERYFGSWVSCGGGLAALPAWVRRLHRVRPWLGAKIVINIARTTHRAQVAA